MKYFLVTTALKDTLIKDEPILFLGDWCNIYSEKNEIHKSSITMKYPWDNRKELYEQIKKIKIIYENLLYDLSDKLNEIHGVDHSINYWRILIGPWLGVFTYMVTDRWACIEYAENNYDLNGTIIVNSEKRIIPFDMDEFSNMFGGDDWNHQIFGDIIINNKKITVTELKKKNPDKKIIKKNIYERSKYIIFKTIEKIGNYFSKNTDILMIATYLNLFEEIFLAFKLKQFPRFLRRSTIIKPITKAVNRNWTIGKKKVMPLEEFLRKIIPDNIPILYVEGYKNLIISSESLSWPTNPKAIWTSSSFYADEVFKVWAAEKNKSNVPLIIGQHGGNYGMGLWSCPEDHELAISTCYFSWGWTFKHQKNIKPVGKIKYSKPIAINKNKKIKKLLLVTAMTQRYGNFTLSMYSGPQWLKYLSDQFLFVENLPEKIKSNLTVRLSTPDYGWNQLRRWKDRFPCLTIDDGKSNFNKIIKKHSLFISTYNATTYLDSIASDIPTVIFWNQEYMEMNSIAFENFEKLEKVGIFHRTPESAALHVVKIWSNVRGWWDLTETKNVREKFMCEYGNFSTNKIEKINNAIREVIENDANSI